MLGEKKKKKRFSLADFKIIVNFFLRILLPTESGHGKFE